MGAVIWRIPRLFDDPDQDETISFAAGDAVARQSGTQASDEQSTNDHRELTALEHADAYESNVFTFDNRLQLGANMSLIRDVDSCHGVIACAPWRIRSENTRMRPITSQRAPSHELNAR